MTDTEMILKGLDLIDDYCTNCNLPEEQDSIEPCRECAKQVLARHDAEVRANAINELRNELCTHCVSADNECTLDCPFGDIGKCGIVSIAEKLKEPEE